MSQPFLLTVVTVTRNCVSTLERTLSSVQAIKTGKIEYVIVDCLSTDGTLELVQRYDKLVDVLISEADTGIYNAMNKAVVLSCGRYLLFINGDDFLIPDQFATVMNVLSRVQDDIICSTSLVGYLGATLETLVAKPCCLPFFNSIPHPSSFVRRELLLRFPFREDLRIASDYDFFLRAYMAGHSFRVLPVITALHHRGGASGDVQRSLEEVDSVRRHRLGWRYPLVNAVAAVYRQLKRAIVGRST